MINQLNFKREQFRVKIRKLFLDQQFSYSRQFKQQIGEGNYEILDINVDEIRLIDQLQNNKNYIHQNFLIAINQLFKSNISEKLMVHLLIFIENYEFINPLIMTHCQEIQLDYHLMNLFKNNQFQDVTKLSIFITITNLMLTQKISILYYFTEQKILLIIAQLIKQCDPEICEKLFECLSILPREFIKMNNLDIQKSIVLAFKERKEINKEYFYLFLNKLTDDINSDVFEFLREKQIIKESIKDLQQFFSPVVKFLINLSFLDAIELESFIDYDFISAIIFTNKNRLNDDLWMLINNLIQTSYSIRLFFYDYNVYSIIDETLQDSLNFYQQNVLYEILLCLATLLQQEDITQKIVEQQIKHTQLEKTLQSIFLDQIVCDDVLITAAQCLLLYYNQFSFNLNENFLNILDNKCNKHVDLENLYYYLKSQ